MLPSKMVALEGAGIETWLGHESEAFINNISVLIKEGGGMERPWTLLPLRVHTVGERPSEKQPLAGTWLLQFPAPIMVRKKKKTCL